MLAKNHNKFIFLFYTLAEAPKEPDLFSEILPTLNFSNPVNLPLFTAY